MNTSAAIGNEHRDLPKKGEIYRHFKGNKYKILAIALKEDTLEKLVIYEALYGDHTIYARGADEFMSQIDRNKYPDAEGIWRFEKVREDEADLLNRFLDAVSTKDRLDILRLMEHSLTNPMIDTMAIACDVEVKDGTVEERYQDLRECLKMIDRYETKRR